MLDWNSIRHNQERHRDFVREAATDRLAAELTLSPDSKPAKIAPWHAFAEWLQCRGRRLSYTLRLNPLRADC